ncbi:MAG: hypothetical protein COA83_04880 [Methylophaga sp.]|nr:MAG: hypothetical protein COA83_04880 [Methylophaga sp.]
MTLAKICIFLGSLNALFAVALGAFGAHTLKAKLTTDMLVVYQTAVQYHFYHALGLLIIGLVAFHLPNNLWLKPSAILMFLGILLFCGSLYAMSVFNVRGIGMITPIGGLLFILAWLVLSISVWRS